MMNNYFWSFIATRYAYTRDRLLPRSIAVSFEYSAPLESLVYTVYTFLLIRILKFSLRLNILEHFYLSLRMFFKLVLNFNDFVHWYLYRIYYHN